MSVPESFPAKVVTPYYDEVLQRDRLFTIIDDERKKPSIWVCAPAGAGKTTLISSYADSRDLAVLWYQVDQGDTDPATFFYYLRLAAARINPAASDALPLYTPEYEGNSYLFSRRFFEQLSALIREPALLVLDNFQDLPVGSGIETIMKSATDWLSQNITLVFVSRFAASPSFSRALANNRMATMGDHLLRFNLEETVALIQLADKNGIDPKQVKKIHGAADGWAAGIILYLKSEAHERLPVPETDFLTPAEIIDYFSEEIFDHLDEDIRAILLATAFLPQMTGEMAVQITGVDQARQILLGLVRANYFINLRNEHQQVFQYHQLFRAFLQKKASEGADAGMLRTLKINSAQLLARGGYWEDALAIYFDVKALESASDLILAHAQTMVAAGRHITLQSWLQKIPPEISGSNPWLAYWTGVSLLPIDPKRARSHLETAYNAFKEKADDVGRVIAQCTILESITYRFDQLRLLDEWIEKDSYFLLGYFERATPKEKVRIVFTVINVLALRSPDHIDPGLWEERCMQVLESDVDLTSKIQASMFMLFYLIVKGDFTRCLDVLACIPQVHGDATIPPLAMVSIAALKVSVFCHMGDAVRGKEYLASAMTLAEQTGVRLVDFIIYSVGLQCAMSDVDDALVKELFARMEPLRHQIGGYETTYWYNNNTWWHLIKKRPVDAVKSADMAIHHAQECGCEKIEPLAYLGKALAEHHRGDSPQAEKSLSTAFTLCHKLGTCHALFGCYLAQAEMLLEAGDDRALNEALQNAFRMTREHGYVTCYGWRNDVIARLCVKALQRNIEVEAVRRLIIARNVITLTPPLEVIHWPWPVRINTLGRFEISIADQLVEFKGRVRQKPYDLLKCIIALDTGDGIPEYLLQDLLWPDAEGDAAVKSYAVTLHRLRQILACKQALRVSAGRIYIDNRYVWVDLHRLNRDLAAFDQSWENRQSNELTQRLLGQMECILELVAGELLPGDQFAPIPSKRAKIQASVFDRLFLIVRHLEKAQAWEAVVHWSKKTIAINDCSEACYQTLMRGYRKLGLHAEAHLVFEQCARNLKEKLAIQPSPATVAERERIRGD